MSYKSVREILNAVFDSDDSTLKGVFKTDGEVLNMVLDETGDPALKVHLDGVSGGGLTEAEKTALAKASKNYLINPFDSAFMVNQRGYASGSVLASGAYGYDRWKVSGGAAVITYNAGYYELTSGTVEQVIENPGLAGQTVTLSADTGGTTVSCEVDGQSGTLPMTVTIAGTGNISVKLTGGKVRNVKLGYNDIYVPVNPADNLASCQRYLRPLSFRDVNRVVFYDASYLYFDIKGQFRTTAPTLEIGIESTNWGIFPIGDSSTPVTGFTASIYITRPTHCQLRFNKSAHGMTDGFLSIRTENTCFINMEL